MDINVGTEKFKVVDCLYGDYDYRITELFKGGKVEQTELNLQNMTAEINDYKLNIIVD